MYKEAKKTWSPYVGCRHGCIYCIPSFQRQAKRQKNRCMSCYNFVPHFHPERLKKPLPKTERVNEFIFACDFGDVTFAKPEWMKLIIDRIEQLPDRTFLIQSKNPSCFSRYTFPKNVILGTTIETNRDELCLKISKAPPPSKRYEKMKQLVHKRKSVTVEPIMEFDLPVLVSWIKNINPEVVYVGYDNHSCGLQEPPLEKTLRFIDEVGKFTEVRKKTLRDKFEN